MSLRGFKGIVGSFQSIGIKWNRDLREFTKELWEEGYSEKDICIAMYEEKEKLIKAIEVGNFWAVFMQVISKCPSLHNNITRDEYWELWQAKERNRNALKFIGQTILNDTPKHTECIYFIQSISGGPIKIGYSNDLSKRIRQLQTYYKQKFEVLLIIPGTPKTEKIVHKLFEKHRLKGEWFESSPAVLRKIEELNKTKTVTSN